MWLESNLPKQLGGVKLNTRPVETTKTSETGGHNPRVYFHQGVPSKVCFLVEM